MLQSYGNSSPTAPSFFRLPELPPAADSPKVRPKLSLASLIGQAIMAQPEQRARLCTIYEWIAQQYPQYYKLQQGGWQNSIRHNLTINRAFVRVAKPNGEQSGKGSYWMIEPSHKADFKDGIFTGKIRSSEYRNAAKNKSKRNSAPNLPSMMKLKHAAMEDFYKQQKEYAQSQQILNSPEQQYQEASQSSLYQQAFVLPQVDYQTEHNPYMAAYQMPQLSHDMLAPPGFYSQSLSYGAPAQIGRANSPSWNTTSHLPCPPNCQCAYCITLPAVSSGSPNPELPVIQASQIPVVNQQELASLGTLYHTSVVGCNDIDLEMIQRLADGFPARFSDDK